MRRAPSVLAVQTAAFALVCSLVLLPHWALQRPVAAQSNTLVISQVYGGGGNSGAVYLNDYIEVFNRGGAPVNVNGWSLQYAGATSSSWSATPLGNLTVPPGGYLLVQEASGGVSGVPLPAPDLTGSLSLAATAGKVALVNSVALLTVANPLGLPQLVDLVGYGSTANAYEGSGPAPAPSAAKAVARGNRGCVDTDDNAVDFTAGVPVPHNSASTAYDCSATPPPAVASPVLIVAFFYNGYIPDGSSQGDEAVELMNVSGATVDLSGWSLGDNAGSVAFPPGSVLAPAGRFWLARRAAAFRASFGFAPQFEYAADSDPAVPDMLGTAPNLAGAGDVLVLNDQDGRLRDAVAYGSGTLAAGWTGPALQVPYNVFPMNDPHIVVYRRLDERTGYPLPDSDTERDWAVSKTCDTSVYGPVRDCDLSGKKPMSAGWTTSIIRPANLPTDDWVTYKVTESANLSVLVGPDNLYEQYTGALANAQHSIAVEVLTLHNPSVVAALSSRARDGLTVTILLDGEPCCAGETDRENLWAAGQLSAAGAQVWFMSGVTTTDGISPTVHHARYNELHAKFTLVDAGYPTQRLLTGSENLDCSSMPPDAKTISTAGNRGYYFKTDASGVIAYYRRIFNLDLDRAQQDIVPYGVAPYIWDGSSAPAPCADGAVYAVQRHWPLNVSGTLPFEVVQCPDNCLQADEGLLGLVRRAGPGDVLLVEQAYERTHWGLLGSSVAVDPNPRLEAYIDAARRGATVRILLDAAYDSITSTVGNAATVAYVTGLRGPGVNIDARLADFEGGLGPAGDGIHAKLVLLNSPGRGRAWVHLGSINGSENASKFNRELALQVESTETFCYLYDVFNLDWQYSGASDLNLRYNCPPFVPDPPINPVFLPFVSRK